MIEEEVVTEETTTPSPEGQQEQPSAQGAEETPGASETPSGQQETETLADGTPVDKPIPHNAAKRMAETAAEKAVAKYKTERDEEDRLAAEDDDGLGDTGQPPPLQGAEDPRMAKFLAPFPKDQWDSLRPSYQPIVDEMNALARDAALVKQVTGESLKKQFYAKYSDLKEGSKDAKLVESLVTRKGYDPEDAYTLVMKTPERMKAQLEVEIAAKNNNLNQVKKNSNTVGGASGTPAGGTPAIPTRVEGSDEYFDKLAYRGK